MKITKEIKNEISPLNNGEKNKMTVHCWWCDTPEHLEKLYHTKELVHIHENCLMEIMGKLDTLSRIKKKVH